MRKQEPHEIRASSDQFFTDFWLHENKVAPDRFRQAVARQVGKTVEGLIYEHGNKIDLSKIAVELEQNREGMQMAVKISVSATAPLKLQDDQPLFNDNEAISPTQASREFARELVRKQREIEK